MTTPVSSTDSPAVAADARGTRRIGWARLDTLRVKLFLAIAGANALLALVAFLVFSWSFDQGLVEYLNRADEARLQPLVTRLAEGYRREGNWKWMTDDRRKWYDLTREVLGGPRTPRRAEEAAGASAPASAASAPDRTSDRPNNRLSGPPPDPLLTIDPRLMLFDAQRGLLVGRPEVAPEAVLRPITLDGTLIGHVGYVPRLKIVESLEKLFAAQQNRKFASIAVGMVLAGLLIGALLSTWLTRRIRRLAQATDELIHGRYDTRIEVQGHDELAQLAQDFNQLAHTLAAAQRARQQWIADIAHELRTPLAVLRAEIEAMQDGVRPLSQASVGSLAQEVTQLARLVEDLRLLSLSDLGALTYTKEALDLAEPIEDTLAAHATALREKGLVADVSLHSSVRVMGDATRLAQVFANLLQNTLRYTDAPGRLSVRLDAQGGQAVVLWQDSSPGVPDADLSRLTERLFRVDGSRNRASGGSGLGLAITQAIVEAHDGTLVASASGLGGVCWRLTVPLLDAHTPAHAQGDSHG
jgi:two-component system sensor histidine kinase BaeS